MQINHLWATGYKNLVDCRIAPNAIHAITGPNGSGKSNLIEVLVFIARLQRIGPNESSNYLHGMFPGMANWPPMKTGDRSTTFSSKLECTITISGVDWRVKYSLEFSKPNFKDPTSEFSTLATPITIDHETIEAKIAGKPGKSKCVLRRSSSGKTHVSSITGRSKQEFSTKKEMSAIAALSVREGEFFEKKHPVISSFRESLLNTHLIRLDVEKFRKFVCDDNREPSSISSGIVSAYEPFFVLEALEKEDAERWKEFISWLNQIVGIEGISLSRIESQKGPETSRFLFPIQHGRITFPEELSVGSSAVLAIVTAIYTFVRKGGVLLIEEPENHLHPGALIELIKLFRSLSGDKTVIFTTHSPVALNSLSPNEVTAMRNLHDGFVTTEIVSSVPNIIKRLERGFLSFGDLLQTDFKED